MKTVWKRSPALFAMVLALLAVALPVRSAPPPASRPADTLPALPHVKAGALLDKPVHVFTLDQALGYALAHNVGLQIASVQQTEAWWGYKMGSSLPGVQLVSNNMGGNNPDATSNGRPFDNTLSLTQSFGNIRQVALNGKSAYQAWLTSRANARQARIALVQQVRDAFYAILTAQVQVVATNDGLRTANHVVGVALGRKKVVGVPRIDVLSARMQQAAAQQAYLQAVMALKQAQNAMAPLLGLPAVETIGVEGDADLPPQPRPLPELDALAQSRNPQIEVAQSMLAQSETQVALVRSQALPVPALSYTQDVHNSTLFWIGATLTMPLDWGQIRYAVRQQLAVVEERKLALKNVRLAVSAAVKTAYDNYQLTLVDIQSFRASVLDPALDLMRTTQDAYERGATSYLQVLVAQQALRQARTQYYQLLLTGHQALDALEAAVGDEDRASAAPWHRVPGGAASPYSSALPARRMSRFSSRSASARRKSSPSSGRTGRAVEIRAAPPPRRTSGSASTASMRSRTSALTAWTRGPPGVRKTCATTSPISKASAVSTISRSTRRFMGGRSAQAPRPARRARRRG
jgi:outer membrane protein TolC